MTKLNDYQPQLDKAIKTISGYNQTSILVTEKSFEELSKHPNRDWDEDDTKEQIADKVIIIDGNWELQIGKQTYKVLCLYLDTDNDWSRWELSMINKETKQWQSLDLRLI